MLRSVAYRTDGAPGRDPLTRSGEEEAESSNRLEQSGRIADLDNFTKLNVLNGQGASRKVLA